MNSDKRRDLMLIENAFVTTLVFAIFRLKHTHTNTHALHICTHTYREACVNFPPSWVICIRDRLLFWQVCLKCTTAEKFLPYLLTYIFVFLLSVSLTLSAAVSLTRSLHRLFFAFRIELYAWIESFPQVAF